MLQRHVPTFSHLGICVVFVRRISFAISCVAVVDQTTRRQSRGCVLLHSIGHSRSNHLGVEHQPRIAPHDAAISLSQENGRLDCGMTGVVLTGRTKTVIHHAPLA